MIQSIIWVAYNPMEMHSLKSMKSICIAFVMYSLSAATDANACGLCVAATLDRALPGIWSWSVFAVVWFLTVSVVSEIRGGTVAGMPSLLKAILLVLILVVAGSVIGPLGALFLLLPLPVVAWVAFRRGDESKLNRKLKRDLKGITLISCVCIFGLIAYGTFTRRTPAEFIFEWEGTYAAKSYLKDLTHDGPEALPDLRAIAEKGTVANMVTAAEGLSAFGQPDIDVPILIRALIRCQADESCKGSIRAALEKLSGIRLQESATPLMWGEEWAKNAAEAEKPRLADTL